MKQKKHSIGNKICIWKRFTKVSIYGVCLLLSLSAMGNSNYFVEEQVQESEYLIQAITQSQTEQVYHFISHGKPGELLIEGQWLGGVFALYGLELVSVFSHSLSF